MKGPILWKRLFRRSAALFLATLAVWLLLLCGGGAGALQSLGESGAFVSTALAAELGKTGGDTLDKLDGWDRLAVGQSLLLAGNQEAVAQHLGQEVPEEIQLPAGQPAQDHDDLVEEPKTTTAPSDIIARTLIPTSPQGYDVAGGLYLYNRTGESVDLEAAAQASVNITLPAEGPQILIIHTHTTEAYTPDGTDVYTPDGGVARTLEEEDNMLRVGDEMERVFTEMGLSVIHDRTVHDYPQYNGAYTRSAQTVQKYLEQYPSIKIVLDVHRDALAGEDGTVYKAVTVIDGVDTAQVMLPPLDGESGPGLQDPEQHEHPLSHPGPAHDLPLL